MKLCPYCKEKPLKKFKSSGKISKTCGNKSCFIKYLKQKRKIKSNEIICVVCGVKAIVRNKNYMTCGKQKCKKTYKRMHKKLYESRTDIGEKKMERTKKAQLKKQILKEIKLETCRHCGITLPLAFFQKDHKTPISRGGEDTKENLQLLCMPCNQRKNTKTMEEFVLFEENLKKENQEVKKEILEKSPELRGNLQFFKEKNIKPAIADLVERTERQWRSEARRAEDRVYRYWLDKNGHRKIIKPTREDRLKAGLSRLNYMIEEIEKSRLSHSKLCLILEEDPENLKEKEWSKYMKLNKEAGHLDKTIGKEYTKTEINKAHVELMGMGEKEKEKLIKQVSDYLDLEKIPKEWILPGGTLCLPTENGKKLFF